MIDLRRRALLLLLLGLATMLPPQVQRRVAAAPAAPLTRDVEGAQSSGAVYRISTPLLFWNGKLVVYAHGYVDPAQPVAIPEDQMVMHDGLPIAPAFTALGYAFATTSYRTNGLAVQAGIADLVDLVDIFAQQFDQPSHVYLVGVSEGGLITALCLQEHADVFDGGLAVCGPYGGFGAEMDYICDFRVLFDYFFPGLIPGSPVDVPQSLLDDYEGHYERAVQPALRDPANADQVAQLLVVSGAAYDPDDPATREETIKQLLWFAVVGANDARSKLGGQPYDNHRRVYSGSQDDATLNAQVQRFSGDASAREALALYYQPSGYLGGAMVTLHTTGDPVVPYWHVQRYYGRIIAADNISGYRHIRSQRYGHCTVTVVEVIEAFGTLVLLVDNPPPYHPTSKVYLPVTIN